MLQDNPLLSQLKQQLHQQTPCVEGIVRANEKGYGFLDVDNKTSYFIPAHKMKKVLNGDKVSGIIVTSNDKESFEPETIVEPVLQQFLAKVSFDNKSLVIIPENMAKMTMRCKVNPQVKTRLKAGDWVKASLISHALEEGKNCFFAEINQFIAEEKSPYLLWLLALARYNLDLSAPYENEEFSLLAQEEVERLDFSQQDFFTIDSKETLDMDDAITLSQDEQGHYHLMVAIADPCAYIEENSDTNQVALQHCFSTYLPNFTVPMLPKSLTNNLCSLKEAEKRPAVVCQITINQQGDIVADSVQFNLAWVTSKAKLSYHDVADFIELNKELPTTSVNLAEQLTLLAKLADIRNNWRQNNALLFKDNQDYRFIFNEERQLVSIIKESKRVAHKMVEEAMVIANQAFTTFINQQLGFAIFNIHHGFDVKYIDSAVKLLNENQITEFDKERISMFDGYKALRHMLEKNDFLEYRLRRFQASADFAFEAKPHFGLGFDAYATWTSPIRKYGDLFNHRLLKSILQHTTHNKPDEQLLTIMNERRKAQRLAEREINSKLYCQFLADKIGQHYQAEIIDINRGGAKVRLSDIGAVAFMPLSLMHPVRNEIVSQPDEGLLKIKDEISYRLLDTVNVTINDIKADSSTIIVKLTD